MIVRDPVLTVLSYFFLIWFIVSIVSSIYYGARNNQKKAKIVLCISFVLAAAVSLFLSAYTAFGTENGFQVGFVLVSFLSNFVLWNVPTIIVALIYVIYFMRKKKDPPEPSEPKKEKQVQEDKLSRKIY
ncbi:hypothetical protein MmiAt1_11530 [Methanimicrococcus sp. At1]|uniref:MFS transporter n=1 Tax=Methanimicrococcus hacksteinii TaxID=3028293 RepID=A0ABU3VQI6_9EURY|nr:hypothetical protein [Methanimicrococcus sp. At1]MDV0445569.1 hypothetical protein [Methanimicrococcus sp. At1]